eukprot:14107960-Heterocapsa_arctica.AAC.1
MGTHVNEDEDISGIGTGADLGDMMSGGNFHHESRPRHVNVKAFNGDRKPGIYREWKKDVLFMQMAYAVKDDQMASL